MSGGEEWAGGCSSVVRALARVLGFDLQCLTFLSCWPGCVLVSDLPLRCNLKGSSDLTLHTLRLFD